MNRVYKKHENVCKTRSSRIIDGLGCLKMFLPEKMRQKCCVLTMEDCNQFISSRMEDERIEESQCALNETESQLVTSMFLPLLVDWIEVKKDDVPKLITEIRKLSDQHGYQTAMTCLAKAVHQRVVAKPEFVKGYGSFCEKLQEAITSEFRFTSSELQQEIPPNLFFIHAVNWVVVVALKEGPTEELMPVFEFALELYCAGIFSHLTVRELWLEVLSTIESDHDAQTVYNLGAMLTERQERLEERNKQVIDITERMDENHTDKFCNGVKALVKKFSRSKLEIATETLSLLKKSALFLPPDQHHCFQPKKGKRAPKPFDLTAFHHGLELLKMFRYGEAKTVFQSVIFTPRAPDSIRIRSYLHMLEALDCGEDAKVLETELSLLTSTVARRHNSVQAVKEVCFAECDNTFELWQDVMSKHKNEDMDEDMLDIPMERDFKELLLCTVTLTDLDTNRAEAVKRCSPKVKCALGDAYNAKSAGNYSKAMPKFREAMHATVFSDHHKVESYAKFYCCACNLEKEGEVLQEARQVLRILSDIDVHYKVLQFRELRYAFSKFCVQEKGFFNSLKKSVAKDNVYPQLFPNDSLRLLVSEAEGPWKRRSKITLDLQDKLEAMNLEVYRLSDFDLLGEAVEEGYFGLALERLSRMLMCPDVPDSVRIRILLKMYVCALELGFDCQGWVSELKNLLTAIGSGHHAADVFKQVESVWLPSTEFNLLRNVVECIQSSGSKVMDLILSQKKRSKVALTPDGCSIPDSGLVRGCLLFGQKIRLPNSSLETPLPFQKGMELFYAGSFKKAKDVFQDLVHDKDQSLLIRLRSLLKCQSCHCLMKRSGSSSNLLQTLNSLLKDLESNPSKHDIQRSLKSLMPGLPHYEKELLLKVDPCFISRDMFPPHLDFSLHTEILDWNLPQAEAFTAAIEAGSKNLDSPYKDVTFQHFDPTDFFSIKTLLMSSYPIEGHAQLKDCLTLHPEVGDFRLRFMVLFLAFQGGRSKETEYNYLTMSGLVSCLCEAFESGTWRQNLSSFSRWEMKLLKTFLLVRINQPPKLANEQQAKVCKVIGAYVKKELWKDGPSKASAPPRSLNSVLDLYDDGLFQEAMEGLEFLLCCPKITKMERLECYIKAFACNVLLASDKEEAKSLMHLQDECKEILADLSKDDLEAVYCDWFEDRHPIEQSFLKELAPSHFAELFDDMPNLSDCIQHHAGKAINSGKTSAMEEQAQQALKKVLREEDGSLTSGEQEWNSEDQFEDGLDKFDQKEYGLAEKHLESVMSDGQKYPLGSWQRLLSACKLFCIQVLQGRVASMKDVQNHSLLKIKKEFKHGFSKSTMRDTDHYFQQMHILERAFLQQVLGVKGFKKRSETPSLAELIEEYNNSAPIADVRLGLYKDLSYLDRSTCLKYNEHIVRYLCKKSERKQKVVDCIQLPEESSTKEQVEVTNPIDVLVKTGCQKLSSGSLSEAILKFDEAAELMKADEANKGTQDGLIIIHYLMALSLCQTRLPENVCKAHRVLTRATESSTLDSFGYRNLMTCLAFANFLRRDYDAAQQNLNKVQETGKALDFETNNVELPFKFDVVSDNLKSDLLTLNPDYLKDVHNFLQHSPKPDGTCRYTSCIKVNHDPIFGLVPSTSIYCNEFKDIDFKGMHTLHCDNKCSINFHTKCWKSHKVENMTGKDIDMLGQHCMTPDCKGVINEISIIKDDGSEVQLNSKTNQMRKSHHQQQQSERKKANVVEKKKRNDSDHDQTPVSNGVSIVTQEVVYKDDTKSPTRDKIVHVQSQELDNVVQMADDKCKRMKDNETDLMKMTRKDSDCDNRILRSQQSREFPKEDLNKNDDNVFLKDLASSDCKADLDQNIAVGACSLLYQELGPSLDENANQSGTQTNNSVRKKRTFGLLQSKKPPSTLVTQDGGSGGNKNHKRIDNDERQKQTEWRKRFDRNHDRATLLGAHLLPALEKKIGGNTKLNCQYPNQEGQRSKNTNQVNILRHHDVSNRVYIYFL